MRKKINLMNAILAVGMILLFFPVNLQAEDFQADLGKSSDLSVFSDKDEKKGSKTTVKISTAGGVVEASFTTHTSKDNPSAYVGFGIRLNLPSGKDFQSVGFDLRKEEGDSDPSMLTLTLEDGKRARTDLKKFGGAGTEWKTFKIALSDFQLEPDEIPRIRSFSVKIGGWEKGSAYQERTGKVQLKNLHFSTDKVESRSSVPDYSFLAAKKIKEPRRGAVAWIYGKSEEEVERIKAYNARSHRPIVLLFVYGGSYEFDGARSSFTGLNLENLKFYRERLPATVEIHPNVDGYGGKNLGLLPPAEQDRLAKEVAVAVNQTAFAQGLHLDIEPYVGEALPFYIAAKKYLEKPLGAAVGTWDRHLLRVVDYPVLMNYDIADSPAKFKEVAGRRFQAFSTDATIAGSRYFLGVPFVATHVEYEYTENRKTGERKKTAYQMRDFLGAAHQAFADLGWIAKDKNYGGVAVWGFLDPNKKGVGAPHEEWGYFPDRLSQEAWDYIPKF